MKVLLDTNIIIHRETSNVVNPDIGELFRWIDNLSYKKYIHPITIEEIRKYKDSNVVNSMSIKMDNYNILKAVAPIHNLVKRVSERYDKNLNDINDTKLLNELFSDRVDILITEDRKIIKKANLLGVSDNVYTIDSFLEQITNENPELIDYKVLSIKKEYFGNINIDEPFFDSFKQDYENFIKWFNKKSEETAYICKVEDNVSAFLYLKYETMDENYSDIVPPFFKKNRLKIGTFKVTSNGFKIGERFMKILFDNAIQFNVEEIYLTIFSKSIEQQRLISLLEDYGFKKHGYKNSVELVYVRNFNKNFNHNNPKFTYPYLSIKGNFFIAPIYPEYHTELFPDSILRTESPDDYLINESYRNAISKSYISRSWEKGLVRGDIILFYRTGGLYRSVITTIGIVESVITNIKTQDEFIKLCKRRTVFSEEELIKEWNKYEKLKPFIVNFLYAYSLPKKINYKRLLDLKIISVAPRGFTKIERHHFENIIREAKINESIIVN